MKQLLLFLCIFTLCTAYAQNSKPKYPLLVLEGTYQGKNVYIQNPFSDNNKGFCTRSIKVNDQIYAFKNESAFIIQLDSMNLKLGDKVKIEIEHNTDCKPKVLYDNSSPKQNAIIDLEIDSTGVLRWKVK